MIGWVPGTGLLSLKKAESQTQIFEFKLPYQPRQEKPTLPHDDVIRLDA